MWRGLRPTDILRARLSGVPTSALCAVSLSSGAARARDARPLEGILSPSNPVMPVLVAGIHVFAAADKKGVDGRDIGERSDAVLRTAMRGHDVTNLTPRRPSP